MKKNTFYFINKKKLSKSFSKFDKKFYPITKISKRIILKFFFLLDFFLKDHFVILLQTDKLLFFYFSVSILSVSLFLTVFVGRV